MASLCTAVLSGAVPPCASIAWICLVGRHHSAAYAFPSRALSTLSNLSLEPSSPSFAPSASATFLAPFLSCARAWLPFALDL